MNTDSNRAPPEARPRPSARVRRRRRAFASAARVRLDDVAAALDAALGAERAALEPITGRTVVARRVDGRPRDLQERVARWFVPGPNDDAASETAGL